MTIGQLWFGWTEQGVEGLNKQQIIAASGILDDRSQPLTQQVLVACYLPRAPAFGWLHGPDLRIAFWRTPTGLDGFGRPGNFFVHVLAAAPDALPPQALRQLYGASIWRREAPSHPHPKLEALADLEALGLAPAAEVGAEELVTVLAGHLASLAHGAYSAIEETGERATAFAAAIAEVLPARFGLRGFSTDEPEQQAHHYDLVAGEPPSGRFALIAADSAVSARWQAAAELLVGAARGDDSAAGAVAAIAEQAMTPQAFANALHGWALLDRRPAPGESPDPGAPAVALGVAAREPRLALRLVAGAGGADAVARAFVNGRSEATSIIATAQAHGAYGALRPALTSVIEAVDPPRAARLLGQLLPLASPVAVELAERAVDRWRERGELSALTSADAAAVASVLAASGSELADGAAAILLNEPAFAASLATSGTLPIAWRAHALATRPDAVAPAALARSLTRERGFASALLSTPDRRVLDAVSAAIAEVPSSIALDVINASAPYVASFEVDEWRWSVMAQTRDPLRRYHELRLLLRHRETIGDIWADRVLDAFVLAVMQSRPDPVPLLYLDSSLLADAVELRAACWRRILRALRPHHLVVNTAIEAANAMAPLRGHDRDAALETIVDVIVDRCQDLTQLTGALGALATRTHADAIEVALRLARATGRPRGRDMSGPWVATVRWLTDNIRSGALPERILDESVVAALGGAPFASDELHEAIGLLRDSVDGPRSLRRWLGHLTQPSTAGSRFWSKR